MSRSSDLGPDGHSPEIRFCRAPDGVRIAYTVFGSGPPLVMNAAWLFHLQYDWRSPVWSHYLRGLGEFATVIRYDERGYGLSDDDVVDLSLDARVSDLEAVAKVDGVPVAEEIRQAIAERIEQRRNDEQFRERLRRSIADNQNILDRLAR